MANPKAADIFRYMNIDKRKKLGDAAMTEVSSLPKHTTAADRISDPIHARALWQNANFITHARRNPDEAAHPKRGSAASR